MADDKPKPIPRKTPKKSSGPSMREQIAARRSEEGAASAAKPVRKAPAAKAAAPKAAGPKAAAPKAARPTSRTGARRAGGGRATKGDGEEEDAGEGRRSRRGRPEPKKKSPLPLIAAAVVAIGGAGGYFVYSGSQSAASETEAGDDADTNTANADGTTAEGGADGTDGTEGATTPEGTDAAPAGGGEAAEAGGTPEAAKPDDKPKPTPKKAGLTGKTTEELAAMVAALEPFSKPAGISDEDWAKMGADADLVFTNGGAASGRAVKRIGEDGNRYAWPLMINRMARIDFTVDDEIMFGMAAQRVMQRARGSKNMGGMGWMTSAETKDGVFNDKAHRMDMMIVIKAHQSWSATVEDPSWWEKKLYKGEMYKEAEELKANRIEGELEGLDDLDIDDLDLDDIDLDGGE